jgi:hypothetical protein
MTLLRAQFDPWGFDGFWWQERELGLASGPVGCEHFRVLKGAVSLGETEPRGGKHEAHIGPDAPFVIPAVLRLPTMVAVLHAVEMETGAVARPIAYFSSEPPPPGSLTAPWRTTTYTFVTPAGQTGWTIKNDPWDFQLEPWIREGKVRWLDPEDPELPLAEPDPAACPYTNLPGRRLPQVIKDDELRPSPREVTGVRDRPPSTGNSA